MGWLVNLLAAFAAKMAQPAPSVPAVLAAYPIQEKHNVAVSKITGTEAAIADDLALSLACLKAVAEVESGGHYRWSGGRIPVLFERHIFLRELIKTKGATFATDFASRHPNLCNHVPGGYGSSSGQYPKIAALIAMGLSEEAYRSASWGAFQILGGNFEECGFASATAMVNFLHQEPVEYNALSVFAKFIGSKPPMVAALRHGDYATFARLYNGPNYAINRYDTKIAAAVAKFS